MLKLKIKFTSKLSEDIYQNGELLKYQTAGSSGFDLKAVGLSLLQNDGSIQNRLLDLNETFVVKPHERVCVQAGISVAFDKDYEIQVRPRSGLAFKNGITIVNTPGTVDSDYRGEIGVILLNTSDKDFTIKLGDRIAQAVVCPVIKLNIDFVSDLDETERGDGRFGSTGKN